MRPASIALAAAVLLAGCGFHPRDQLKFSDRIGPLRVETADAYSPLGLELASALTRSGASAPGEGEPAAALKISREIWDTAPLSVDQFAQVREYVTRYRVDFALQSAEGKPLIEAQSIELSREYTVVPGKIVNIVVG